ncbi:hypothetical protein AKJ16_DCAP22798 [Drosera capensis]
MMPMRSARKSRGFPKSKPVFGKKPLEECTTSGNVNHVLSQSKPVAGKRTLRGCTKSLSINDVVLIDVDSDDFHDVIIVDLPESLLEKLGRRSTSKVISIDDDDEEGHTDSTPDEDANPTSRDSYPASTSSPVNLSKFKRTYSGKVGSTNRYGLGPDSEFDSSDSDCSDCELMEGSTGKLREQWEHAFQKRKNEKHKIWSGSEVHADPPASNDSHNHCHGEESREKVQAEDRGPSSSARPRYEDETFPPCTADGNDASGKTQGGATGEATESDFVQNHSSHDTGYSSFKQFGDGHRPFCNEDHSIPEASMPSAFEMNDNQANEGKPLSRDKDLDIVDEPCLFNRQPNIEHNFVFRSPDRSDDEPNFKHKLQSVDADPSRTLPLDSDTELRPFFAPSECNLEKKTGREERRLSEEPSSSNPKSEGEGGKVVDEGQKVDEEQLHGSGCRDMDGPMEEDPAAESSSGNPVVDNKNDRPPSLRVELSQDVLIIDRQKLKETDEYKRAMEEEVASRQQQLQIQAEEAQRLRRRKRAETARIMDMERRQKQRVEEIRETQKKDMENMNMKEQLRANIRNELHRLEITCSDMASLLRSLGVHVGINPTAHEVHAAYKKAALRFHPDRASRSDLRQQVESEERFKLISRMKESFLHSLVFLLCWIVLDKVSYLIRI